MPLSALTPAPVMYNMDISFPSSGSEITLRCKAYVHLQNNFTKLRLYQPQCFSALI
jgi:hypothetical protein